MKENAGRATLPYGATTSALPQRTAAFALWTVWPDRIERGGLLVQADDGSEVFVACPPDSVTQEVVL